MKTVYRVELFGGEKQDGRSETVYENVRLDLAQAFSEGLLSLVVSGRVRMVRVDITETRTVLYERD